MTTNATRTEPRSGRESVWVYLRPPRIEHSTKHVQVIFNGVVIADLHRAKRVLETSHPPVYYLPPDDVEMEYLSPTSHRSFCEWKGEARYFTIGVGVHRQVNAACRYPRPTPPFAELMDSIAFYPARMDACFVDGERVIAQPGDFSGGWVSSDIVGPFKGEPGTTGW